MGNHYGLDLLKDSYSVGTVMLHARSSGFGVLACPRAFVVRSLLSVFSPVQPGCYSNAL